ncbi:PH domain-containing protein [Gordonia hydrophobica]|uniref:PH domain-containing protein n=1 Tax=Gordonia hydrophobica TaxID=40516 RepID=A0ABZ2U579_9ACTN|nr:PH domain-containing protein [Gordonia hydrophobica]MBM7368674.1 hypothetical protein [Gordonia hydrophobica]
MDNSDSAVHDQWATPLPAAIALLGVGIALAAAAAASYTDPPAAFFIGIAALAAAVVGVISLVRRPRLALVAGPALIVKTVRGTRRLTVDDVEQVSLLHSRRLVGRTRQLIIDLPDDRLLVFGRWDLGEEPTVVVEKLQRAGFPADVG